MVHLKLRFADFRTIIRSQKLSDPTATTDQLWETACQLQATRLPTDRQPIRLLGMGVSGIDRTGQTQQQLFDVAERQRSDELDQVADTIRDRFGSAALRRGSAIEHGAEHRPQPRPGDGLE